MEGAHLTTIYYVMVKFLACKKSCLDPSAHQTRNLDVLELPLDEDPITCQFDLAYVI